MARILVIDDEPRITNFLARGLAGAGFDVARANDARDALDLVQTTAFDLLVLDLRLGAASGIEVLKTVLRHRPGQRVLILSALDDVELKVECLELGAVDYLTKPFALSELVVRMRLRLREAVGVDDHVLEAGRLRLDLRRRTVDPGSGPIPLSTREFLLLKCLMRNNGDVCAREQLLSEVWGYSFETGTNIVDVYVRKLRAKLGDELIDTIRGVGYAMAA